MRQRYSSGSRTVAALLPAMLLGTFAGCEPSGPTFVEVSGVVTFEGAPVEEGTIMFLHDETQDSRQAEVTEGGNYRMEVLPGAHKIAIEPLVVELPGGPNSPPSSDYQKAENIPRKYRSSDTSGFAANVDGPAEFSFDMKKTGSKR